MHCLPSADRARIEVQLPAAIALEEVIAQTASPKYVLDDLWLDLSGSSC
jgi:hypothetical protein